jgi:predicted kinase
VLERWVWAKDSDARVVLLGGKPGTGKSRVVSLCRSTTVYRWITEDFDTQDLEDARALLEDLE